MAARINRMPASDCRYHREGRCLYEERLNPGYHQRWRCDVLKGWEEAYDDFLDRAEAFGLEAQVASRMWGERLSKLVARAGKCSDFVPGGVDNGTGCANEFEALCMRRMPPCEGMCRRYERVDTARAGGGTGQ